MDHRQVVGKFFEEKTMQIFNLERADSLSHGDVPDLVSEDKSFYVRNENISEHTKNKHCFFLY